MDFILKIFPNKKKYDIHNIGKTFESEPHQTNPCNLDRDGIRVLLYRECDRRGRKLLFDSHTVVRVSLPVCMTPTKGTQPSKPLQHPPSSAQLSPSHQSSSSNLLSSNSRCSQTTPKCNPSTNTGHDSFVEVHNGYGYQYLKKKDDTKQIGELVFGSVALAYKGSSSKLHLLCDPSRLMLSRTNAAPRSKQSFQSREHDVEDSITSSLGSISDLVMSQVEKIDSSKSTTWPVDMPHIISSCNSEEDSGIGGPPSPFSSTCGSFLSPYSIPNTPLGTPSSRSGSGNSLQNSGSLNSLQRRFLRNVTTSLDSLISKSGGELDDVDRSLHSPSTAQKSNTRLGLAVIIDFSNNQNTDELSIKEWFFSKQAVLESAINKLKFALESAYVRSHTFVSSMHKAITEFQQVILDLVCGVKLTNPMWLKMLSDCSSPEQDILCKSLVNSLTQVLSFHDTKHTNFFVSKLLTAVLSFHLGWVATVAPAQKENNKQSRFLASKSVAYSGVTEIEELNQKRPYCALWGQLCELCGAVGFPLRSARTIIVGSNQFLLENILTVLSYLIRCSQVIEHNIEPFNAKEEEVNKTTHTADNLYKVSSGYSLVTSSSSSQTSISTMVEQPNNNNTNKSRRSFDNVNVAQTIHKNVVDVETSSKWMLNDDVEIIIGENTRTKLNKSLIDAESYEDVAKFNNKNVAQQWPIAAPSTIVPPKLTSTKTMTNLLSLAQSSPSDYEGGFYPNLVDFDDHRETFGSTSLQPNVIAQKVQKLCRVPSHATLYNTQKNDDKFVVKISGTDVQPEMEDGSPILILDSEPIYNKHSSSNTSPPQAICDISNVVNSSFSIGNSLNDDNTIIKSERCKSVEKNTIDKYDNSTLNKRDYDNRTKGNFAIVEQHLKACGVSGVNNNKGQLSSQDRRGNDKERCVFGMNQDQQQSRIISNENFSQITCLPEPTEIRKVVKQRYVGRESNLELTQFEKNQIHYPTINDLKGKLKEPIDRKFNKDIQSHKRNNSDPLHKSFYPSLVYIDDENDSHADQIEHKNCASNNQQQQKTLKDKNPLPLPSWINMPKCSKSRRDSKVYEKDFAESLFGGVLDHYSSAFILHATTDRNWEDRLRQDLFIDAHYPVHDISTKEAVAIVADTNTWEVEVVSSHSVVVDRRDDLHRSNYGGQTIGISPLIASISDMLVQLSKLNAPSSVILQALEDRLREIYIKSHVLADYLLGGASHAFNSTYDHTNNSLFNLNELTRTLSIDLNDLPLLLAVASTHTPALTQMFGISIR